MTGLLDLPPELFRIIIQEVIGHYWYVRKPWFPGNVTVVSQVKLVEAIDLRLVNKLFDQYIMNDIIERRLLSSGILHVPRWCRICRLYSHQNSSWAWRDSSWFEARYMLIQQGRKGKWNDNIVNLLNHLVDEVGRQEDRVLSESDRYQYLHDLCQALWPMNANWRAGRHHGMLPWLHPKFPPITSQPIEFLVVAAQIILGMDEPVLRFLSTCNNDVLTAEDEVFGTLFRVAARAGRYAIINQILGSGVDILNLECHRDLKEDLDNLRCETTTVQSRHRRNT
ncbi:hypothetical protein GGR52DRAFT_211180 [Hypoxylon sp. FL1284]|nr:hypothetical protein GGR52DRAFT_211180 [Hypoxylon sp. FL1284]